MNLSFMSGWKRMTARLTDSEKGRLIDAIIGYAEGDERAEEVLKGNEAFVFPAFAERIDSLAEQNKEKDDGRSEDIRKKRSEAGKRSAAKRAAKKGVSVQQNPTNPTSVDFVESVGESVGSVETSGDVPPESTPGEQNPTNFNKIQQIQQNPTSVESVEICSDLLTSERDTADFQQISTKSNKFQQNPTNPTSVDFVDAKEKHPPIPPRKENNIYTPPPPPHNDTQQISGAGGGARGNFGFGFDINLTPEEQAFESVMRELRQIVISPSPMAESEMRTFVSRLGPEVCKHGIWTARDSMGTRDNGRNAFSLVRGILERYVRDGTTTVAAIQQAEEKFREQRRKPAKPGGRDFSACH